MKNDADEDECVEVIVMLGWTGRLKGEKKNSCVEQSLFLFLFFLQELVQYVYSTTYRVFH